MLVSSDLERLSSSIPGSHSAHVTPLYGQKERFLKLPTVTQQPPQQMFVFNNPSVSSITGLSECDSVTV